MPFVARIPLIAFMGLFLWLRRVGKLAAVVSAALCVGVLVTACRSRAYNAKTANTTTAVAPDVRGHDGTALKTLTEAEAVALQFVSHGKIPTWEGLVADTRSSKPTVHLIDTARFDGHYGYTRDALGRGAGYTQDNFFIEVQFPDKRRYMPFFLYDFRAKPLVWNSKSYTWVLQIRRYNYRDTHDELADMIVWLKGLLQTTMVPGQGEPLLLVYDTPGSFRRPHTDRLTEVHARGFATLTEQQMIDAAGASLVSVLNPGVAVAYINIEKAGADQSPSAGTGGGPAAAERLTPRHIAVFEDTPDRVPPVAGIVTLEPQTPLSHVNLLAKNRGTLNVSTPRLDLIPGLEKLEGKLVRMEAKADGAIAVKEISTAEAKAWWESQAKFALEVPKADFRITDAVEFGVSPDTDTTLEVIGAKASNYAAIQKLLGPVTVRPGFALGFGVYRAIAQASGAQVLVDALVKEKGSLSPEEIDARLEAIRETLTKKTPEAALAPAVAALRGVIAKLPGVARIRFRSSTNSEDLPVFNGAGLYESDGFNVVDDDAKMRKKLLGVQASLWLPRAFWEREFFGIDHSKVAMGILVNPAFSDETANGVVVANRTAEGFRTWVNAQQGEASVTNPENGEIPESFVFVDETLKDVRVSSRSNIGNVFLASGSDDVTAADAPLLLELKRASEKLHDFMVDRQRKRGDTNPYAIDIEFKVMTEGGVKKLWVKQSRLLSLVGEDPASGPHRKKLAVAKDNGLSGGHLRRAPKQLKDLPAGGSCLLPANAVVGYDTLSDAGAGFVRINVTIPAGGACASFFGDVYVFKSHFNFVEK